MLHVDGLSFTKYDICLYFSQIVRIGRQWYKKTSENVVGIGDPSLQTGFFRWWVVGVGGLSNNKSEQILTHWGNSTIIASDNGVPPGQHKAIIWTNGEI